MKIINLLSALINRIHSEVKRTLLGICGIVLFVIIVNHFIACGFYGLHHGVGHDKTWVNVNFNEGDELAYRYWTAMHWSLTQFTPASMEVVPVNTWERFYTVCALLLALITFSSFISSITNAMTELRRINGRKLERDSALLRFLAERSVSSPLVNRIWHCIGVRDHQAQVKARVHEAEVEHINTLPESLRAELRCEVFIPVLQHHPLLQQLNLLEPPAVRQLCRSALREHSMASREELFGDCIEVNEMIFVLEGGPLVYQYPDDEGEIHRLEVHPKTWACEAALWSTSFSLVGPFVATGLCELITLRAAEFVAVLKWYPASKKFLASYAFMFVEQSNAQSQEGNNANCLGNDRTFVNDLVGLAVELQLAQAMAAYVSEDRRQGSKQSNSSGRDSETSNRSDKVVALGKAFRNLIFGRNSSSHF